MEETDKKDNSRSDVFADSIPRGNVNFRQIEYSKESFAQMFARLFDNLSSENETSVFGPKPG